MKSIFTLGRILTVAVIVLVTSCVSETEKQALGQLDKAKALIQQGEFEKGLALLDSIPLWFPQEYGILKESLQLRKETSYAWSKAFIEQAEKMKAELEPQLSTLTKNFYFEPGVGNRPGTYEHKRQTVRRSWSRSFLKANVSEDGQFWISSHYYGSEWIDHTYIKVYDKELKFFSDTIPLNHPDNRKLQDGNDKWEFIDFRNGTDRGIAAYIAEYMDRKLKVRFSGKNFQYIVMESFDKDAIKEGLELAQLLKELNELNQKISKFQKELRLQGFTEEAQKVNSQ